MTHSIRRPKPCSQSREAARMRAMPQSPFSIASWCGLLHASRLMRPLLGPSYFHARLLPPKVSHHDYSALLGFAEVPFRVENGQNRQQPSLISYTKDPVIERFACAAYTQRRGSSLRTPEENAGKSNVNSAFGLRLHVYPTEPAAIATAEALHPPDSRGATGRFHMRAFIYLYNF